MKKVLNTLYLSEWDFTLIPKDNFNPTNYSST